MKLSIITITYNAEKIPKKNHRGSILAQSNQDFNYIIIDGKSIQPWK